MLLHTSNTPLSLQRMRDGSETSSWLHANTKPCPKCSKPTRVEITRTEDGKAQRVCKKCAATLED